MVKGQQMSACNGFGEEVSLHSVILLNLNSMMLNKLFQIRNTLLQNRRQGHLLFSYVSAAVNMNSFCVFLLWVICAALDKYECTSCVFVSSGC